MLARGYKTYSSYSYQYHDHQQGGGGELERNDRKKLLRHIRI